MRMPAAPASAEPMANTAIITCSGLIPTTLAATGSSATARMAFPNLVYWTKSHNAIDRIMLAKTINICTLVIVVPHIWYPSLTDPERRVSIFAEETSWIMFWINMNTPTEASRKTKLGAFFRLRGEYTSQLMATPSVPERKQAMKMEKKWPIPKMWILA